MGALDGLLAISLEQAVAAPRCTALMADAGARVIKVERPEGDFARGYDATVGGLSSYFVWLNRGKQSICLDLRAAADRALLGRMIARADVFVQNLKPGALARLGFDRAALAKAHPRLIMVSISGYGESGPMAGRKAYDLLIQAEAGLASITGGPDQPARVGISVVDIATGHAAYEAVLAALIARGRTGRGADIRLSMFDVIAEWMAVPLLQHEGGQTPKRIGLAHPSIAPYGVFRSGDDAQILISIQSDREWRLLCDVLGRPDLAEDPRFATNLARVAGRAATDAAVAAGFAAHSLAELCKALGAADIAFGAVNDMAGLSAHPHLRRLPLATEAGQAAIPAPAMADIRPGPVPARGEQDAALRAEFRAAVTPGLSEDGPSEEGVSEDGTSEDGVS
ncbi:MAG: CaiB/BaiF CoA-transferase family protein [Pseudomonadota bacterium]